MNRQPREFTKRYCALTQTPEVWSFCTAKNTVCYFGTGKKLGNGLTQWLFSMEVSVSAHLVSSLHIWILQSYVDKSRGGRNREAQNELIWRRQIVKSEETELLINWMYSNSVNPNVYTLDSANYLEGTLYCNHIMRSTMCCKGDQLEIRERTDSQGQSK